MGKKTKKPGKGKEKTEKKTAKAEEKKARRETKKLSPEDDIDAILVLSLFPFTSLFHSQTKSSNKLVYISVSWINAVEHSKRGSEEEGGSRRWQRSRAFSSFQLLGNAANSTSHSFISHLSPLTIAISVLTPSLVAHRQSVERDRVDSLRRRILQRQQGYEFEFKTNCACLLSDWYDL